MFRYTTTIGIRKTSYDRFVLSREEKKASSPYGPVRIKRSEGYGTIRAKAEYDDLERIARANNISLAEAAESIEFDGV